MDTISQYIKNDENINILYANSEHIFESISIENEPDEKEVAETVFHVYGKMLQYIKDETVDKVNIYIESNGGIRYVLTMLLSITNTLESVYEKVNVVEITSMVFNENKNGIITIENTKSIYDTAQLTGCIDEFLNYGRSNSIQKYINEYSGQLDEQTKKDTKEVLDSFKKFSDDIQLCRTRMMLNDLYGNNSDIVGIKTKIDNYKKKYTLSEDMIVRNFLFILEMIEQDFNKSGLYVEGDSFFDDNIIYLPRVISWCLERSFTQQALTLIAERIPEYWFKTEMISLSDDFQEKLDKQKNNNENERYYFYISKISDIKQYFVEDVLKGKNIDSFVARCIRNLVRELNALRVLNRRIFEREGTERNRLVETMHRLTKMILIER